MLRLYGRVWCEKVVVALGRWLGSEGNGGATGVGWVVDIT